MHSAAFALYSTVLNCTLLSCTLKGFVRWFLSWLQVHSDVLKRYRKLVLYLFTLLLAFAF